MRLRLSCNQKHKTEALNKAKYQSRMVHNNGTNQAAAP